MRCKLIFIFVVLFVTQAFAQLPEKIQYMIDIGDYSSAQQEMKAKLCESKELDYAQRRAMMFEIERLDRIRLDFTKDREQVIEEIQFYIPNVTKESVETWEANRSLEYKIIDGEKKYFKNAVPNLFRIDKRAMLIKKKAERRTDLAPLYDRMTDVKNIINASMATQKRYVNPKRLEVTYRLIVDDDAVPPGHTIRSWLPYPREVSNRQVEVEYVSSDPARHIIADNQDFLQRSIYFEKKAEKGRQTEFRVTFRYTSFAEHNHIDPELVQVTALRDDLKSYTTERPPHIVFTPELRQLSERIVGTEKNPYRMAQRIFRWIDENIPWASAREYSTFRNISDYVYENRHADCGMQTIFFMTLCRMNNIPTRWQSGWTTEPGDEGMHDWGEIYFEPYGWVPVDVTYGLNNSKNEVEKWFFLGGMDGYRLIVNDDYSQKLYPEKIYPRSETIDFQRGEVEWEGGNLYFNQWDYSFDVKELTAEFPMPE
ncbi:transglutaminase domain-containing protein [candidate division KSB1 bacterium]|nr:transglutaminase domain-containing protein [candidate division KSB1 bacterium]